MQKNVFILALDAFNLQLLQGIHAADRFQFHGLLEHDQLVAAEDYPMHDLLEQAEHQLLSFKGEIDGLLAYWDFPASTMAAVLHRKFGLPGPSLESVLRCEHKFWSRLEQAKIVPELVPRFCSIDPFRQDPLAEVDIAFPFWLKPVRAHSSHLGFHIAGEADFQAAIGEIRNLLHRFAEPFNTLCAFAEIPPEVAPIDGYHCIAEEIISADEQCTLEGFVFEGGTQVYGIVDSLRDSDSSSFTSYRYPTDLPAQVQQRMIDVTGKVMQQIDYDGGPFNMEFFYQAESERLSLLEINARISKSHCPLFALVEGASHHEVAVNLAVGEKPRFPQGDGPFACAQKFMLRRFDNARVKAVPTEKQLDRLHQELPEAQLHIYVEPGDLLADLQDQDSYSYEYAVLFLGGQDQVELREKYQRCLQLLSFEFESVPEQEN